jgi:hypothetical protein
VQLLGLSNEPKDDFVMCNTALLICDRLKKQVPSTCPSCEIDHDEIMIDDDELQGRPMDTIDEGRHSH